MAGFEGLLTGRVLADRYRIEEVIGRGGMAAVYRARDTRLDRDVAVKVMTAAAPDAEARERMRARFHREAHAAARLQHPNVVTVFDFGTDPELELDFLVMEMLEGEDLAAYLAREGRPPLEVALRVLRHAARGVAAGHEAGLVHRDVKPGNVFLAGRGSAAKARVCVLDFGIAQITAGDETITSLTRGRTPLSPAYASPEQLLGERPLTAASDVYSLGVIAYELLTGQRPFGSKLEERARDRSPDLRARNPEVPAELAAVIERALAYEPEQRFSSAGELVEALQAAEERRQAIAAAPPPPAERHALPPEYRARRRARLPEQSASPVAPSRRGAPLGAVVAAVLAAVLLGGWWLLGRGGNSDAPTRGPSAERSAPEPEAEQLGGLLDPGGSAAARAGTATSESGSGSAVRSGGGSTAAPPPAESRSAATPEGAPAARTAGAASALTLHQEGMRRFEQRDFAGAVDRFRQAVRMEPDNVHFRNNLAWALFRAGELDAATRELDRVLEMDPSRDIAHANLGEVRAAQGDTTGAIAAYRRFLELNTDPARERVARGKLTRLGAPPR